MSRRHGVPSETLGTRVKRIDRYKKTGVAEAINILKINGLINNLKEDDMKIYQSTFLLITMFIVNSQSQLLPQPVLTKNRATVNSIAAYTPPLDSTALDSFIVKTMQDYYMVGLAACVVKNGQIKWHHNYGHAHLNQNILVTDSTLFLLASISKTFVTTAMMQLWENGLFDLDEDINQYLPEGFQVHNPYYPDNPITFKMLLTHTSSIRDNWEFLLPIGLYTGGSPIKQDILIFNYLDSRGKWYTPEQNFYNSVPGESYKYSNIGFTLLGYLVEQISEISFERYCQENIFKPLDMNNSSWFLANLNTELIAMPYYWSGSGFLQYGYYEFPFYSCGQLRTSSTQLANFLNAYMNQGTYHHAKILDSLTVKEILKRYVWDPNSNDWQGLGFYQNDDIYSGGWIWGHSGAYFGANTYMCFNPEEKWGFIALSNTGIEPDLSTRGLFSLINPKLYSFAEYFGEIYAYAYHTNRTFLRAGNDSLVFQTRLANTADKDFSVEVHAYCTDTTDSANFTLYDDGNHSDSLAGDSIWGSNLGTVVKDKTYSIDMITTDHRSNSQKKMSDILRYTSIGPLEYDGYQIMSSDQEVNPGDQLKFRFRIRNKGSTATANNVTSHVIPLDSCASINKLINNKYGNIAPGTSVEGTTLSQQILFNANCGGCTARFALEIMSDNYPLWCDTFAVDIIISGNGIQEDATLVKEFNLEQNYPNPFNPLTTFEYTLPKYSHVRLVICNLLGKNVKILVDAPQQAGSFYATWDGTDDHNLPVAAGIYICSMQAAYFKTVIKVALVR